MSSTVSEQSITRMIDREHDVAHIVDSTRLRYAIVGCACGVHTLLHFAHLDDEITKINQWLNRHRLDAARMLKTELGLRTCSEEEP